MLTRSISLFAEIQTKKRPRLYDEEEDDDDDDQATRNGITFSPISGHTKIIANNHTTT